jgi:hypothetical protein
VPANFAYPHPARITASNSRPSALAILFRATFSPVPGGPQNKMGLFILWRKFATAFMFQNTFFGLWQSECSSSSTVAALLDQDCQSLFLQGKSRSNPDTSNNATSGASAESWRDVQILTPFLEHHPAFPHRIRA